MAQSTEQKDEIDSKVGSKDFPTDTYKPQNNFVNSLLTDLYQITMTYAYWKNKHVDQRAVFDLFFRKCPFKGEYCIFAGLDDVLRFLNTFGYSDDDIAALKQRFPTWDNEYAFIR